MSSFTDDLTMTHMVSIESRLWRIERDLAYEVGSLGSGKVIVVPHGFLSDGASVPRVFWIVAPAWGKYSRAAVLHDFLCWRIHLGRPHPEADTRRKADAVFYEAMRVTKTSAVVAGMLWFGARMGGLMTSMFPFLVNIVTKSNPKD